MIIDSPIISGSYAASGSLNQLGNVVITGSLTVTGPIIGAITGSADSASYANTSSYAVTASYAANVPQTASYAISASNALTASYAANVPVTASYANNATSASYAASASNALNAVTASYLTGYISPFPFTGSAGISGSLTVNGPITATTLVVQTVTSSTVYSSGSNIFGNNIANSQIFTGSVIMTGSLAVTGSVNISGSTGNLLTANVDTISFTGSFSASGSVNVVGGVTASLLGTASFATSASFWSGSIINAATASFVQNAQTASYVLNAVSSSFSTTASFATFAALSQQSANPFVSATTNNVDYGVTFALSATPGYTTLYRASGLTFNPTSSLTKATNLQATGSLLGTSSFANNATSASNALVATSASYALTASYSANVPVTASYANNAATASYSLTSSYSLSGGGFPYSGSAEITGSLLVSNLSGTGVRYIVADATGSIFSQTPLTAIKLNQVVTASAGQNTFNIPSGYTTGLIDTFINGTKLTRGVEYTDLSGTQIILTTGSFAGDIIEFVVYQPASGVANNVLRQQTTFTASAGQTVFSASYTPGLLDIFYNGSRLSNNEYTANNGTFFTLATGSAVGDILDVFVYSYQVGAFSGIGGVGVANQFAYFNTTNSITSSNAITISGANAIVTGSLLGTASYADNAGTLDGLDSTVFTLTSSFNSQTASFTAFTASQTIANTTFTTTSSFNAQTASFTAFTSSILSQTASINAFTSSAATRLGALESYTASQDIRNTTYATTGSNTFVGTQYVSNTNNAIGFSNTTSSIYTDGGLQVTKDAYFSSSMFIKGNLTIFGTQSVNFITSSQLNISTNIITVNTSTPSVRFGGLAVQDSGSTGLTGSILWDSQDNQWIYTNPSGSEYDSAMFLVGPRNSGSLGNEVGITTNALAKGNGAHHMTSSAVFEVSGSVGIGTATPVTKLDVIGNQRLFPSSGDVNLTLRGFASQYINFTEASVADRGVIGFAIGSGDLVYRSGGYDIVTGTERIRITSGGNVGIGTTSPNGVLDISSGLRTGTLSGLFIGADSDTSAGTRTNDTRKLGLIASPHYSNATRPVFGIAMDNQVSNNFIHIGGTYSGYNAATTITFSTGLTTTTETGTERMRITNSGSIGIGTVSPQSQLHIYNSSGTATLRLHGTRTADGSVGVLNFSNITDIAGGYVIGSIGVDRSGFDNGGAMIFSTATAASTPTERMRITSGGNVGLGNTSPTVRLQVSGTIATGDNVTGWGRLSFDTASNTTRLQSSKDGTDSVGLSFWTQASGGGFAERMTISGSNVGIGITNPLALLHIQATEPTFRITDSSDGGVMFIGNTGGYSYIRPFSRDFRFINASGTSLFSITSAGNVGIGISNPSQILHIVKDQNATTTLLVQNTADGAGAATEIRLYGNEGISPLKNNQQISFVRGSGGADWALGQPADSSDFVIAGGTNQGDGKPSLGTAERIRITSTGNVGIGVTNPEVSFVVKGTSIGSGGKASFYGGGDENNWSAVNNEAIRIGRADILNGFYSSIWSASGSGGNELQHWLRFYISNGSNAQTLALTMFGNGNVSVAGALSKGSGSFRIKHPLLSKKNTHELVHSFIEGPQADLIYRGRVRLVAGRAIVNIDEAATMTEGTFEALCREVQCFTSNETGWDAVRGKVEGNILTIECQNTESTDEISWMVVGERQDEHMMDTNWTDSNGKVIVEPLVLEEETTII